MKNKEFKNQIEQLGYGIGVNSNNKLEIVSGYYVLVEVSKSEMYGITTFPKSLNELPLAERHKLMNVAIKYIRTEVKDREDEPKFYVKLTPDTGHQYPNWLRKENVFADVVSGSPNENGCVFDKSSYSELIEQHPEWRPFLLDYDANNTDVFVPVTDIKDGDHK